MPRPKPTAEWKTFRRNFKITQRALADLMAEPGEEGAGCRRTIQMIESGKISPHKATLTRFAIVKNRIETENA
jgi:transcriptional regulator with XRE-family HTH domain